MIAPLEGIRVIDWTQVQSGPSCTQILYYLQLNCNKRSIELDMKTSEGKEILTGLLETPPALDEHTDEVLKEIGYTPEEITSLRQKHIVCK